MRQFRSRLYLRSLESRITPANSALAHSDSYAVLTGTPTANPMLIAAAPQPGAAFDAAGNALIGNKSRIADRLLQVYQAWKDGTATDIAAAFPDQMLNAADNAIGVMVTATDVNGLVPQLEKIGFEVLGPPQPDLHFVEGFMPFASFPQIESLAPYGLMGAVPIGQPQTSSGLVTSQGDWVLQTNRVRALGGFDGSGQRIGVLSNSLNRRTDLATTYSQDVANGDLSAVQLIEDGPVYNNSKDSMGNPVPPNVTDEGRAMLQLVHDMAPGASLSFASAALGQSEFAANIGKLADPAQGDDDVIVDDEFYYGEPMFQHGVIAQAIDAAYTNHDVAYYTSAGNNGNQSYESTNWQESGGLFDFDPSSGVDTTQGLTISKNQGIAMVLQWDNPFYTTSGVTTDLDIRLYRGDTNALVASSLSENISTQVPSEAIYYTNKSGQTSFYITISRFSGPAPGRIKWVNYGNGSNIGINEWATNSSALTAHAGDGNAEGTGAAPYFNSTSREGFTSEGRAYTIFSPDGNTRYTTPFQDGGPYIAAVDGTNTTFFGGDSEGDGFGNFYGTSAAAPTAAAIAALVRQENPGFTAMQTYQRLETTATDIDAPGFDLYTGVGLVNAYSALYGSVQTAEASFSDGFESGALGPNWQISDTNTGRAKVTSSFSPDSGSHQLVLGSEFGENNANSKSSLTQAILNVNAAGANNLVLTFNEKEFNDTDNPMPSSFTGTSNSDGVAISVDGNTWYRLVSFTGSASTNSYQAFSYDLVQFAASHGITLSDDTRIKFQEYGSQTAPNDGIAIDNVAVTRHGGIAGYQVNDANGNGISDAGDSVLAGWTTYLDSNNNGQLDRGIPLNYAYGGGTKNIPDYSAGTPGELDTTINFPAPTGPVINVTAQVNITHTYIGDLDIYLISPTGISVQLMNRYGFGSDNMDWTTFDDTALTPAASGYGPFAGAYRPASPLAAFNGMTASQAAGNWTLRITDNAGGDTGTLNGWEIHVTSESNNTRTVSVPIPDYSFPFPGIAHDTTSVSGLSGPIDDVNVTVNINHTYDGDLILTLISPTGVRDVLANRLGNSGENFTNTSFDDSASGYIANAAAPFTGTFRPSEALTKFDGLSGSAANGTWTLEVSDNAAGDAGTLVSWSLQIGTGEQYYVTDAGGFYDFTNELGALHLTEQHKPGWRPTNPGLGSYYAPNWVSGTDYGNSDFLVVADTTAPIINSITQLDPSINNANSVRYQVYFTENVIGVSAADFALNPAGGLSNAIISSVTGTGSAYTVTINTGTGSGTLQLEYTNSYGLTDYAYNAVAPTTFYGPAYTIDRTPPTVTSINATSALNTALASVSWTVTFSESVTGVNVSNFILAGTGITGADISSVTGSGATWTVTANTGLNGGLELEMVNSNGVGDQINNPVAGLPAYGSNYTVNKPVIVVDDPVDENDGNTSKGHLSLREAVGLANSNPNEITFDPTVFGTAHTITLTLGEIDLTGPMVIAGPGQNLLTINGNDASRLFSTALAGAGAPITFSGLTMTGGFVTGNGGAIVGNDENLTVDYCSFTANFASGLGQGNGGAIYMSLGGTLQALQCSFIGNKASARGGAVCTTVNNGTGQASFVQCTISGNTANLGGGLFIPRYLFLDSSTVSGNSATSTSGGGIVVSSYISNQPSTVRNSTIAGNSAKTDGGGIVWTNSGGNMLIENSTIVSNTAGGTGGGFARSTGTGSITLTSTVIAQNSSNAAADLSFNTSSTITANNNLIGVADQGGFTLSGSGNQTGTAASPLNPQLGSLANNGGPTLTIMPLAGSPLIDAGANPSGLPYDQRGTGFPRALDGAADIGAYETTDDLVVRNTNDSGPHSLRQVVLDAGIFAGTNTITFDPAVFSSPQTITLTSGDIPISDALTITGPGSGLVTVSGNNATRIFTISSPNVFLVTMSGLTLTGGNATFGASVEREGGAILVADTQSLTMSNCVLIANFSSQDGGAVYSGGGGTFTATDCTFANNTAINHGGAIFDSGVGVANARAVLALDGCTISGNTASIGGGVYAAYHVQIADSTISGNTANGQAYAGGGHGGGILGAGIFGGLFSFTVVNTTITGNSAANDGGGIDLYYYYGPGNGTVQNCTITANTAGGHGGGIAHTGEPGGTIALESSIVSKDISTTAPEIYMQGSVQAKNCSIYSKTGVSTFTDLGGNRPFGEDPLLGPLTDNGGPTLTIRPMTGSPLIDAGSNPDSLSFDERGFARTVGAATDIGAVETGQTLIVTNTNDNGIGSLRQAVLGGDVVAFSTLFNFSHTITLTTGEIPINHPVTISGKSNPSRITVNGNGASRIFDTSPAPAGTVISITGLTITGGSADGFIFVGDEDAAGGAIFVGDEALHLSNCVITGNQASAVGGGIYLQNAAATLSLSQCTLSNNQVPTGSGFQSGVGGGIDVLSASAVTIDASTISGNSANYQGGGIYFFSSGSLTLTNSTVSGNKANNQGGGIYFFGVANGAGLVVRNSTLSSNTALSVGGAVCLVGFTGTLTVQNSTIADNSAAEAGGIASLFGFGSISLESSIVGLNSGGDISSDSAVLAKNCSIYTNPGNLTDLGGNRPFGEDPLLGPLTNNGGPTLTQALLPSSPCIDAGSNPANQTTDQRGSARVSGANADIGAVETNQLTVLNINDSGTGSLRQAMLDANSLAGPDQIDFDPTFFSTPQTIKLLTALPDITDNVGFAGASSANVVVTRDSSAGAFRLFNCNIPGVGSVAFSNMTLTGGSGSLNGAAIYADNDNVTVANCQIANNSTSGSGGAIAVAPTGGIITVTNSTLSGNTAKYGGAIYFFGNGSLIITGSTISGNTATAQSGGGLYLWTNSTLIRNSTISGNVAQATGGGIALDNDGSLTIQNSTVAYNTAQGNGGGIRCVGLVNMESTIVAKNISAATGMDIYGFVTANHSLIGDVDAGVSVTGANNLTGTPAAPLDPRLAPLANNGGPTKTHALLVGSPAINAGSNPANLATDQRGLARNVFGVDIGAYEFVPTPAKVASVVVNNGQAQRSRVTTVTVNFDVNVTLANPAAAFQLLRQSDSASVTLAANVDNSGPGGVVTLSFIGGAVDGTAGNYSLADGRYTLTILANQFGAAGFDGNGMADGSPADDYSLVGSPANGLFRLFGDADGNGTVNAADFLAFRLAFLQSSAAFDFDNSGTVDAGDFLQFRLRFLQMI